MSPEKQRSKRKQKRKAAPLLGAAGLSLSLATGASASMTGPTTDLPTRATAMSREIILAEEEVSDVSLAKFCVVDRENSGTFRPGRRFAMGGACAGCSGCGGCGCWTGNTYSPPLFGSDTSAPHKRVHMHKSSQNPKKT